MDEKNFTNNLIEAGDLPRYESVSITPVDPSYWHVIVINVVLIAVISGLVIAYSLFMATASFLHIVLALSAWLLFMMVQLVVRRVAFRRRGYAVRMHDIVYRKGVLATVTTIVPFNRIQHVSIHEGFFSRRLGLAQLQIFTAGGASANMTVAGLPKHVAERIRTYIMGSINHGGEPTTGSLSSIRKND